MINPAYLSVILLALSIIGYVTEVLPAAAIALSSCCIMVILGGVSPDIVFAPFAQDNVLLMAGMLVVGITLSTTGTMSFFARRVGKMFHQKTEHMILAFYCCLFITSAFINNSSATLCFLPLFLEIIIESKDPEQHYEQKYIQAISIVAHCGGMLTLMGSSVNLTASGLLESYGYEGFSYFTLAPYGLSLFVASIAHIYLFGNRVTHGMRNNPSSDLVLEFRSNYEKNGTQTVHWSRKNVYSLLILFFTALSLATAGHHGISRGTIGVSAALLCGITGCLDFKTMVKKLNWKAILTLGGMLGFSKCLTSSGGAQIIAEGLLGVFGTNISPKVFLCIFTVCTFLMTQFVSNVSTAGILIPIALPAAAAVGVSPLPVAAAITAAASCAFLTPMASYLQVIVMDWGSYKFADFFKYSWPLAIVCILIIVLLTPLLYPLV
ncbi:MAG: TRAP transporter large permease subunit [Erysipelotrichaceae bacterium]|nr:TRAP transporter large permease subunit [Erysipelotrichaceae bacterium]